MGGFGFSEYVPFIDPKLILKKISSIYLGKFHIAKLLTHIARLQPHHATKPKIHPRKKSGKRTEKKFRKSYRAFQERGSREKE